MFTQEMIDEVKALAENDKPHWRVMYHNDTRKTFVACLQYHDYFDYKDTCGFVNETKYLSEAEAEMDRIVSHFYG